MDCHCTYFPPLDHLGTVFIMSTSIADLSSPDAAASFSKRKKVLVSILNWNRAERTEECLISLKDEVEDAAADVTVLVIDNGSREEDYLALQTAMTSSKAVLKRISRNLGFTGGHNVAIEMAINDGYDFIWLLNNDAVVERGALGELVAFMEEESQCGVVSPVLRDMDDGSVRRCVNVHQWHDRTSTRIMAIEEARKIQKEKPESLWVEGTAVLFRVKALEEVGLLDDRLFAYYDDNDISARLSKKGWHCLCAFDATVFHDYRKSMDEFPPYLMYLMQRNEMLFWYSNMPDTARSRLWLKLVDRALFDVARLYHRGFDSHADAALLGVFDFIRGKFGPPRHERKVPFIMRLACGLSSSIYARKLSSS